MTERKKRERDDEGSTRGKAERTREAIRIKAEQLFQKKGIDAVTMRELAESCGLSLGAFYYHYKSKEEIVCRRPSKSGISGPNPHLTHSQFFQG